MQPVQPLLTPSLTGMSKTHGYDKGPTASLVPSLLVKLGGGRGTRLTPTVVLQKGTKTSVQKPPIPVQNVPTCLIAWKTVR